MKSTCHITREFNGCCYLEAPYEHLFIESFKAMVPKDARFWIPNHKAWWIDQPYVEKVDRFCQAWFLVERWGW